MSRILYLAFPAGRVAGGHKMILRHVETLRELGFDAAVWTPADAVGFEWIEHRCPIERGSSFRRGDILVIPEDASNALAEASGFPLQCVVFCQNQFGLASHGFAGVDRFPPERFPIFVTPGRVCGDTVRRLYPQARVEVVQSFADERVFRPREGRRLAIALTPRKRPGEAKVIQTMLRKMHPRHAGVPWIELNEATEAEVAEAFGTSALFLCLSRMEAAPMTPLEAMASGAICAGFRGVGGREHSDDANGFWAEDDDCEAAADALASAADLVVGGGPALERMRQAGFETARRWSYAAFRPMLEAFWADIAPQARTL
ncbi:glycosyltransferase [Phenylobacterium sp. J426]|uniref:glycosyltransferase n=1 Tax=Phenylobacterium sp. J426 TaxID=2898439 RepID=UPI0021518820|nr:glycosyltransferase [Phenylobacterium sp. J426]MCR5873987.1 glycosyltransferase [Phenylobacterium sp. J426]